MHGRRQGFCAGLLLSLMGSPTWAGVPFEWGPVSGNIDTLITAGVSVRVQDRDPGLISQGNGGEGLSSNIDDGNLNYDKGDIAYAPLLVNQDLTLRWNNFGFFASGQYFYDPVNVNFEEDALRGGDRPAATEKIIGKDIKLLDAYAFYNGELFEFPFSFRVGKQVISWGESSFIQFGLNAVNTYDQTKLRFPGAELKNVFVPEPLAYLQLSLSDNLGMETFYKLGQREIIIDPQGSLYGQVDGLAVDGQFLALESRFFNQNDLPDGYKIFRRPDVKAPNGGQYGVSLNYVAPWLDSTEFGLYFMNVHSSLPVTSGFSLSAEEFAQLNQLVPGSGIQDPTGLIGVLAIQGLLNPEGVNPISAQNVRDASMGLGGYRLEYLEDIKIYGLSFNTSTPFGMALQGEFSYRQDQPLQIDDFELVYHGLSPVTELAGPVGGTLFAQFFPGNQLGQNTTPGERFDGFRRLDVMQLQFTGSYLFGPRNPFGAAQWVMAGEVGATKIRDLPSKDELRFEGPGTFEKGGTPGVRDDFYSGDFGWGYRIITFLNYPNIFGSSWGFNPVFTFFHDVNGTPAGPARSFIEDRMTASANLRFDYLQRWSLGLNYVSEFGRGSDFEETNLQHDRDNLAAYVKYAF
jgi:hypothetical protein